MRLLLSALLAVGCAPAGAPVARGGGCATVPPGEVRVFLEIGGPSSFTFDAVVVSRPPANDSGFLKVALRDSSGADHMLSFRSPLGSPPLRAGDRYRFQVDYVPGYPPASAILVWDGAGLLLAAASDQALGRQVLKDGVPGFELKLLPSNCGSRAHNECYDSIRNLRLSAAHDGGSATLFPGESADIGRYRITCLTAQEVTYNSRCADAGLVAVSYVIARAE